MSLVPGAAHALHIADQRCYRGSVSGAKVNRIGTVIGDRFRIDEMIGHGAMADVFRAFDLGTQTAVALKVLHRALAGDETSLARFAREAEVRDAIIGRSCRIGGNASVVGGVLGDKTEIAEYSRL